MTQKNLNKTSTEKTLKILVVDDEQAQLDTVCRGLFLYGFECIGVLGVNAAIETLKKDCESIDLVLTDLTMPDKSGLILMDEMSKRWAAIPIAVITGLAATPDICEIKKRCIPILKKPFHPDELKEFIYLQLPPKNILEQAQGKLT